MEKECPKCGAPMELLSQLDFFDNESHVWVCITCGHEIEEEESVYEEEESA